MKINVDYKQRFEEIEMRSFKYFDTKTGRFKNMVANFGGRHLPF